MTVQACNFCSPGQMRIAVKPTAYLRVVSALAFAVLWSFPVTSEAAQNGYCWNDKIGWINMSGVTFTSGTRTFGGSATLTTGEIDFTAQGNLTVTLATTADGDGNFRILGQAFSEQVGWVVADHGGTAPAAMKSSGELTGNFWSNEIGWINCSSSDVGAGNVHVWDPGSVASSSSSQGSSVTAPANTGGGGGRRGGAGRGGEAPAASTTNQSSSGTAQSAANVPSERGVLKVTIEGTSTLFRDVPADAWFASAVWKVIKAGIASGYRDNQGDVLGLYGPANPVTYAEIVKMALSVAGKIPAVLSGTPQNRSAQDQWSAGYIKLAEDLGLSVYGRDLNVNLPASRGAVVQTIVEALRLPLEEGNGGYRDLSITHPYAGAIATATQLGIINGDTNADGELAGTVRPDDPINRAEVAMILARILDLGL